MVSAVFILLVSLFLFLENYKFKKNLDHDIALKTVFSQQVFSNAVDMYKLQLRKKIRELGSDPVVLHPFVKGDKKELEKVMKPLFTKMQKDDQWLHFVGFYDKNGQPLMQQYAKQDSDEIVQKSKNAVKTYSKSETEARFVQDLETNSLTYRVIEPIFDAQDRYIGAITLSIDAYAVFDIVAQTLDRIGVAAAIFVPLQNLKELETPIDSSSKKVHYIKIVGMQNFLEKKLKPSSITKPQEFTEDGAIYRLHFYKDMVSDGADSFSSLFVLQFCITSDTQAYSNHFILLLGVSFVVVVLVLGVLNYGFNHYLRHIEKEHQLFIKEHEKAQLILDSQQNLVVLVDGGVPVLANRAFLKFFSVADIAAFRDRYNSFGALFKSKKGFFSMDSESQNWLKNLNELAPHERKVVVDSGDEEVIFDIEISEYRGKQDLYVLTFDDITQVVSKQDALIQRAYKDGLTAIYNRRYYERVIGEILKDAAKGSNFFVMLFDIDKFKHVNDTYGHNFGDEILKMIAETVSKSLRDEDIFIRWGGEEFVIIVKNGAKDSAILVAQKLRKLIKADSVEGVHVTCSFGVTQLQATDDEKSVIQRADAAMYEAKKQGRDRVVYF